MLTQLSIRNVVLIDRLDIDLAAGLIVLTGETGAGKSILLDALGLALGLRAESRLLRKGEAQAVATASFDIPNDHPARLLAMENGIEDDGDEIILRRVLGDDGRTRGFVNDQPVSVGLLKRIGELLVEIHGQFDTQRLLDPAGHRELLDAFGVHGGLLAVVGDAYETWRDLESSLSAAEEASRLTRENEQYLRHAAAELRELAPEPGEESSLAEKRRLLQHGEQISSAMTEATAALGDPGGAEDKLAIASRALERVAAKAEGRLDAALDALARAASEAADASGYLERAAADLQIDPKELENAEERLFALRAAARKHGCAVDALSAVLADMEKQLASIETGDENLARLRRAVTEARKAYAGAAERLRDAREKAATRLDAAMADELAPLKLGGARFSTLVEPLAEDKWSAAGADRVAFQVATNPGADPGPLNRIASGGELARFMLALKVVLAGADPVPVLVFDEVDAGIGGAVAAAVGDRLAALSKDVQVLVVTHSPQVAARGRHHLGIRKDAAGDGARTILEVLGAGERQEEIARMLSGASVTAEARAAAESLLKGAAE